MLLRQPRSTRTDTLFPYTSLCRPIGFECGMAQSDAVIEAATLLQQHHVEHRATLTALVEAAEGEPFETANPVVKAALVDPSLVSVTVERDFVRLVHDLELACAQLYVHIATAVNSSDARRVGKECVSTCRSRW